MKQTQLSVRLLAIPLALAGLLALCGCAGGYGGFPTYAGPGFNAGFGPGQFDYASGPSRQFDGFKNHDDRDDHHAANQHDHNVDFPRHEDSPNHDAGDRHPDAVRSPSHESAPDRAPDAARTTVASAPEPSAGKK